MLRTGESSKPSSPRQRNAASSPRSPRHGRGSRRQSRVVVPSESESEQERDSRRQAVGRRGSQLVPVSAEDEQAAFVKRIQEAPERIDVHFVDQSGYTALHYLSYITLADTGRLVGLFCGQGAAVDARGPNGRTPLHVAASQGRLDIIVALLVAGAEVEDQTASGATSLHLAAAAGHDRAIQVLLRFAGDVDVVDSAGNTAVHIAVLGGYANCCTALLAFSAASLAKANKNGLRPIHLAAMRADLATASVLMLFGASAAVPTGDGKSIEDLIPQTVDGKQFSSALAMRQSMLERERSKAHSVAEKARSVAAKVADAEPAEEKERMDRLEEERNEAKRELERARAERDAATVRARELADKLAREHAAKEEAVQKRREEEAARKRLEEQEEERRRKEERRREKEAASALPAIVQKDREPAKKDVRPVETIQKEPAAGGEALRPLAAILDSPPKGASAAQPSTPASMRPWPPTRKRDGHEPSPRAQPATDFPFPHEDGASTPQEPRAVRVGERKRRPKPWERSATGSSSSRAGEMSPRTPAATAAPEPSPPRVAHPAHATHAERVRQELEWNQAPLVEEPRDELYRQQTGYVSESEDEDELYERQRAEFEEAIADASAVLHASARFLPQRRTRTRKTRHGRAAKADQGEASRRRAVVTGGNLSKRAALRAAREANRRPSE